MRRPLLSISSALLIFASVLFSFDTNNQEKAEQALRTLTITDTELPDLPETPFNYEDFGFPEHILFSNWGETDTTVVDFVTNDGATLGRILFYDEKLSALENISCASCHSQEFSFADDAALSEGVTTLTKRNSLQLNDIGWSNNMGFFWDMSQNDLQEMIKLPLKDDNEVGADIPLVIEKLNDTEYYPELFEKAFGDSEITEDRITGAITQFISSMVTFNSRRDKALKGEITLTPQEEEGMHIFEQACGMCHFDGANVGLINVDIFVLPFLFSNGLDPRGESEDLGMGEWMGEEFNGLFKIPTLRNIEQTGPYMHDGRFETLEDVITFYSEEVNETDWSTIPTPGFEFDEEQKENLLAFMKTFTDESFLTNPKWSDPFKDANSTNIEEIILGNNILVSPNPFSDQTTIRFDNENEESIKIYVINSSGQIILSRETTGSQYQLDKDNLVPGVYFLDVVKSNKSTTVKIVVQ